VRTSQATIAISRNAHVKIVFQRENFVLIGFAPSENFLDIHPPVAIGGMASTRFTIGLQMADGTTGAAGELLK
jgi:hypothetical protein